MDTMSRLHASLLLLHDAADEDRKITQHHTASYYNRLTAVS